MNENPIPHSAMFDTPSSLEDLMEWIERMSGSEKAVAMVSAGMAMNLAYYMVEDVLAEKAGV
jgi:hypothetical protein